MGKRREGPCCKWCMLFASACGLISNQNFQYSSPFQGWPDGEGIDMLVLWWNITFSTNRNHPNLRSVHHWKFFGTLSVLWCTTVTSVHPSIHPVEGSKATRAQGETAYNRAGMQIKSYCEVMVLARVNMSHSAHICEGYLCLQFCLLVLSHLKWVSICVWFFSVSF